MSFFGSSNKNKRKFGKVFDRRVFVAIFLVPLTCTLVILGINSSKAYEAPIKTVEITSDNSSFDNEEAGAWKVRKSAEWIDTGKARITFDIESIIKYDTSRHLDVIMMIDTSGSMTGAKIDQVRRDVNDLVDAVLNDADSRMAVVLFNETALIASNLTNNKSSLLDIVNGSSVTGTTNYNQAYIQAQNILEGYTRRPNSDLVLLLLTDGSPNVETPNEIAQYRQIKARYPYSIVNGVQYEMGDTMSPAIIAVSDYQHIANINSLRNILFEAVLAPYLYDEFVITDYINDDYWLVNNNSINVSAGDFSLDYEGDTPKITWDLSENYRAGETATMTIDIDLKSQFVDVFDYPLLLPTNRHEVIRTSMENVPSEDKNSLLTPVLKDKYDVIYDSNKPSGCDIVGVVPDTVAHTVFTNVIISDNVISCDGYIFKGWQLATSGVHYINDDYFRMPDKDVYIRGVWAKLSISKSLDGTPHLHATATFDTGNIVNRTMKNLSGQTGSSVSSSSANSTITGIMRSETMSQSQSYNARTLSSRESEVPIYGWFENGIIYYYTTADDIYLNSDSSGFFRYMTALTDIETVKDWKAENMKSTESMFRDDYNIVNIDALSYWKTNSLKNMSCMFYGASSITNVNALRSWNTSKVTNVTHMFHSARALNDISALSNWSTDSLVEMYCLFFGASSITNVDSLSGWDTSRVNSFSNLFNSANSLSDINGIRNWDLSSLDSMNAMFEGTYSLLNFEPISNWNTGNVTEMGGLFRSKSSSLRSVEFLRNWDVRKVVHMSYMFYGDIGITSLEPLFDWNTSSLINVSNMFYNIPSSVERPSWYLELQQ